MIKLIVSDIDGTLVTDGASDLNPELYEVIDKLRQKGILFMAASGRQFASQRRLFRPIANRILYAVDNGSIVREYDQIITVHPLPSDVVPQMVEDIKILITQGCDMMVCDTECAYVPKKGTPMYNWLKNSYHYDVREIPDLVPLPAGDLVKISIYHPSRAEEVVGEWFVPKWQERIKMACAGIQWVDCFSMEANKGNAVCEIQKRYGITKEETMAFGDNLNDIEMLEQAEYSYAIGNAREEVKKAAKYQTDTNKNDGVLKVLKKLLL